MKKKHWFLRIFSFFAIFSFLINCMCCSAYAVQEEQKVSLEEVLDSFGFSTEEKQDAFKFICEKAGVHLPERFGTHELLQLVASTQERFVNRKDKQERWETTDLNWMDQDVTLLNENFAKLNLVDAVFYGWREDQYAKQYKAQYDAVCILGARKSEMEKRIKFVERLVTLGHDFDRVVLLTGERYATVGVDGTAEEIEEIAQHFEISSSEVTEAYIFKYLYEQSCLNKGNFSLLVIDTPARDGRRPTTQTTVEDFCKWNKEHPGAIEDALFISSQPYVAYQTAIIEEILRQNNSDLLFRVAGDSYVPSNDSVKTLAGALGSYIWIKVLVCLSRWGFTINSYEDLERAKRLYFHMMWLYKCLIFSPDLISLAGINNEG